MMATATANIANNLQYTRPMHLKCLKWLAWLGGAVIVYGLAMESAIWWAGLAMVAVYWMFDYMDYQDNSERQKEWRRKRERIKNNKRDNFDNDDYDILSLDLDQVFWADNLNHDNN